MTLLLHYHPLASFCHKVQIALYETGTPFEARLVDLANPDDRARLLGLSPIGKMPVLEDSGRGEIVPETSIIIEYLHNYYPGTATLLPDDPDARLKARLWDRIFDLHVQDPMQQIVLDTLQPPDRRDPDGMAAARQRLETAYAFIDDHMTGRTWAAGDTFTMADCAAAPALFFAGIIVPFGDRNAALEAYFERLLARPSVHRVLVEARPYFDNFPFRDSMPDRFLALTDA